MHEQRIVRQSLAEKSLGELADEMAERANSTIQTYQTEFLRRQVVLQEEASRATKSTAEYTKQNARYMLWSVIVLALSAAISTVVTVTAHVRSPVISSCSTYGKGGDVRSAR